jgi:outer membrane protein assembly factor BamB
MVRALALLAALALGGCGSFWPWSGPSKPKMPEPPAITAPIAASLAWNTRIGAAGVGFAPVAVGGAVFAASADGQVVRIDPAKGTIVWRVDLGMPLVSGVGSDGETVVVAARDGSLIALGADSARRWSATLGGEAVTVPAVGQGLVVLRSSDNRIQAFETDSGKRRWSFQRQNPPLVLRQTGSIAIESGTAYVGLPGGRIVALSLLNGAQRWEATVAQPRGATEIERISDVVGTPVVSGREVCAASYQGKLVCFDATTGRPQWSRDVSTSHGIDVDASLVSIVDERDRIQAFSRSGASVWRQEALSGRILSAPLSLGPVLVVGDSKGLVHLVSRDDGAIAGRFATDGSPIVVAPVASGRLAIVQTSAGMIAAVGLD